MLTHSLLSPFVLLTHSPDPFSQLSCGHTNDWCLWATEAVSKYVGTSSASGHCVGSKTENPQTRLTVGARWNPAALTLPPTEPTWCWYVLLQRAPTLFLGKRCDKPCCWDQTTFISSIKSQKIRTFQGGVVSSDEPLCAEDEKQFASAPAKSTKKKGFNCPQTHSLLYREERLQFVLDLVVYLCRKILWH